MDIWVFFFEFSTIGSVSDDIFCVSFADRQKIFYIFLDCNSSDKEEFFARFLEETGFFSWRKNRMVYSKRNENVVLVSVVFEIFEHSGI